MAKVTPRLINNLIIISNHNRVSNLSADARE